jgi:hypothetical protein
VWELRSHQRRLYHPLDSHCHRTHSHAAAFTQHRIGEDRESVKFEQHRAVTEPCCVQALVRPALWMGNERRWSHRTPALASILAKEFGRRATRKSRCTRQLN